ncbi:MAG TPA: tyrosine-type recombinase/integrase [Solirubrobacteraceae bacterium]|nr:tyrosine-type recombinase/integrase [Solirubrobacteraceae bacterium]
MIPGDVEDAQGFPVMVVEFCEHLAIRGYAPTSLKNQRTALALLADWLIERGVTRPCEVTKPMLDAYQRAVFYMRKRNGQPLSFRTQEQRLIPVRGFFRWLVRTNRILYNPASEIELPRTEQRLPRGVLSAEEAERVLALPDLSDPLGLRDRAMMELLYATGIRRAELGSLSIFELDVERQTLTVRQGKGRKDRMIPTGARAAAWCARYLQDARPKLATPPDDGTLFLTVDGVPFSLGTLTYLMRDYVRRSGGRQARRVSHLPAHDGDSDARRRRGHPLHPADARPRQHHQHPGLHPSLAADARRGPRRHAPRLLKPATPPPPGRRDPAPGQLGAGRGG